jgi:branched-subunit amino acid aminotransferase/4-amino-4-deoxychorismate lyase
LSQKKRRRDLVITGALLHDIGKLGVPFMRRRIAADELRLADEVMLASTSVCVLPVVECDGRPIGDGAPGPPLRAIGRPHASPPGPVGN